MLLPQIARGQEFVNYDHAYIESIRSVQLYVPGLQIFPPYIPLRANAAALLFNQEKYLKDTLVRDARNRFDTDPEVFYKERDDRSGNKVGSALRLSFDDLSDQPRRLYYKIVHCDVDWNESDIPEHEYLEEYNEQPIMNYEFSLNTEIPYVHYWLGLPNRDQRWKLSGNYMIHVWDDDTDEPILSKRFLVFEDLVKASGQLIRPFEV